MNRSKRIAPVQKVMEESERERAQIMALAQRRVSEAESKLRELSRYHVDYAKSFHRQAAEGLMSSSLRDFQVFLARLAEAAKQQEHIVARAREDLAAETHRWQDAARRAKALGLVVNGWLGEERLEVDRREQRDTDERGQWQLRAAGAQH
ncbi:MAG: flagellar export protein FliJ [Pseudomonadota bacterium]